MAVVIRGRLTARPIVNVNHINFNVPYKIVSPSRQPKDWLAGYMHRHMYINNHIYI